MQRMLQAHLRPGRGYRDWMDREAEEEEEGLEERRRRRFGEGLDHLRVEGVGLPTEEGSGFKSKCAEKIILSGIRRQEIHNPYHYNVSEEKRKKKCSSLGKSVCQAMHDT